MSALPYARQPLSLTASELIAAIATVDRKDLPALLAAIAACMAEPERAPENDHTDNGTPSLVDGKPLAEASTYRSRI